MKWGNTKQVFDKVLTFNYKVGNSTIYWVLGAVSLLVILAVVVF